MHALYPQHSMGQLPKIDRLIKRYSGLPLPDPGRGSPEMNALSMKLKLARSLILAANPELDDVISMRFYHHKSNGGAYAQALIPSVRMDDDRSMHRNSEILRARIACVDEMMGQMRTDAEDDKDLIRTTLDELQAMKSGMGVPLSRFRRRLFPALHVAGWCAFGAAISGLQNIGSTLIMAGSFAMAGLAFMYALARKAKQRAIQSGDFIFTQGYENELKRLEAGFRKRYPGFSERIEGCRKGLDELLDNLLSQMPDGQRRTAERDICFIERNL